MKYRNPLPLSKAEKVVDDILSDGKAHSWVSLRKALQTHYNDPLEYSKSSWKMFIQRYKKKLSDLEPNILIINQSQGRRIEYRKVINYVRRRNLITEEVEVGDTKDGD